MWCKFPYNENFVVFAKKHVGGNGNLIINFAWPYHLLSEYMLTHISCLFLCLEPGHTEELQGKISVSLFTVSLWLLYIQPVMSEGKTADMEIRVTLDAVKSQNCQMGCCERYSTESPLYRADFGTETFQIRY